MKECTLTIVGAGTEEDGKALRPKASDAFDQTVDRGSHERRENSGADRDDTEWLQLK